MTVQCSSICRCIWTFFRKDRWVFGLQIFSPVNSLTEVLIVNNLLNRQISQVKRHVSSRQLDCCAVSLGFPNHLMEKRVKVFSVFTKLVHSNSESVNITNIGVVRAEFPEWAKPEIEFWSQQKKALYIWRRKKKLYRIFSKFRTNFTPKIVASISNGVI